MFLSYTSFLVDSFGFSVYKIMPSTSRDNFYSFLSDQGAFYLSGLTALAGTSSMVLNSSGENEHPVLFLIVRLFVLPSTFSLFELQRYVKEKMKYLQMNWYDEIQELLQKAEGMEGGCMGCGLAWLATTSWLNWNNNTYNEQSSNVKYFIGFIHSTFWKVGSWFINFTFFFLIWN